jgi:outer membrane protein assembly factor BamB
MNQCIRIAWLSLFALALVACGGAAQNGDDPPTSGTGLPQLGLQAKPTSKLRVSPATINLGLEVAVPQEVNLIAEGVRGARPDDLRVAPLDAVFDPVPVVKQLANGQFSVLLRTAPSLAEGQYTGVITLRLCKASRCSQTVSKATVSYAFRVQRSIPVVPDWQTHQGNAGHTGFVPVTLDPGRFAYAWEWRRSSSGTLGFINAVVTDASRVFVTDDEYFGTVTSLYALNEADGLLAWRRDFVNAPALNPPAVANGTVYAATTGHEATFLWAFRASDGAPVFKSAFAGQWPHVLAPTVKDGRVFTNGGYYGGGVYGFDATSGASLWSSFSGDDDMSTPAVDASNAYHYSGTSLEVYSVATGARVASIADPQVFDRGYSYHGSPVLGSPDNILAFSGGAFSGRASSSVEQYESRLLANFSLNDQALRWRSSHAYLTAPAVANGVVYAARNNPKSLDALDERTGQVLWSWTGTAADTEFHRNVLVTNNLVFVSTDRAVHAIDLSTRQSVWSYPAPGMLALSAAGTLYIVEGAREPTGRLIAIRLR